MGSVPKTYVKAVSLMKSLGEPPEAVPAPPKLPPECHISPGLLEEHKYDIPTLEELGVDQSQLGPCIFPGGETEGLARLEKCLARKVSAISSIINVVHPKMAELIFIQLLQEWICSFEKPKTFPNSLSPSTTVLSPYIRFGCVSSRLVYHKINKVLKIYTPRN